MSADVNSKTMLWVGFPVIHRVSFDHFGEMVLDHEKCCFGGMLPVDRVDALLLW